MNPTDLARLLDELGQKLGPPGEYVFGLAVRQKAIEGGVGLALLVVLVAITVVVTFIFRWRVGVHNARYPDETAEEHVGLGWKAAGYGIIWALAACVIAVLGVGVASNLLNPEYAALTDILGRIVK